jgi:uroporphyrin-III C-methyltransferase
MTIQSNLRAKLQAPGDVTFLGAGPGDPELLTLRALRLLEGARVVIHDRLVTPDILALINPAAKVIEAGKRGFGPATPQACINALIVAEARAGQPVIRLKGGDPVLFGRLDEEVDAVEDAGLQWQIVPGITAASAATAAIGQSLTRRARNGSVRFITGHDMQGFADHDWRALSQPGAVTAVYMGKAAARYLQGRLMMHGGHPDTPVTLIENASMPDERILVSTLARFPVDLAEAALEGPALMLLGLAPRAAHAARPQTLHHQKEPVAHAP